MTEAFSTDRRVLLEEMIPRITTEFNGFKIL